MTPGTLLGGEKQDNFMCNPECSVGQKCNKYCVIEINATQINGFQIHNKYCIIENKTSLPFVMNVSDIVF